MSINDSNSPKKEKEKEKDYNESFKNTNKSSERTDFNKLQHKILDNYKKKIKEKLSDKKNFNFNKTFSLTDRKKNIPQEEKNQIKEILISKNNDNIISNANLTLNNNRKKFSSFSETKIKKFNQTKITPILYRKYDTKLQLNNEKNRGRFISDILTNMKTNEFNFTFNTIINNDRANSLTKRLFFHYFSIRRKLINKIRDVHNLLNFNKDTFYNSIYYLDIICNKLIHEAYLNFETFDFKNLAISCLILSSKFTDNDPNIPNVKLYLAEVNSYSSNIPKNEIEALKQFEINSLKGLSYKLDYSNPFSYLKIFYTYGFIFTKDLDYFKKISKIFIGNDINNSNNSEDYYNDKFNNFLEYAYKKCDEISWIITVDENFLFDNNYNENEEGEKDKEENEIEQKKEKDDNNIREYNSFKISCGLISNCREILYKKMNDEFGIENELEYEIWGNNLQELYSIKFDEFRIEYELVKNCYINSRNKNNKSDKKILKQNSNNPQYSSANTEINLNNNNQNILSQANNIPNTGTVLNTERKLDFDNININDKNNNNFKTNHPSSTTNIKFNKNIFNDKINKDFKIIEDINNNINLSAKKAQGSTKILNKINLENNKEKSIENFPLQINNNQNNLNLINYTTNNTTNFNETKMTSNNNILNINNLNNIETNNNNNNMLHNLNGLKPKQLNFDNFDTDKEINFNNFRKENKETSNNNNFQFDSELENKEKIIRKKKISVDFGSFGEDLSPKNFNNNNKVNKFPLKVSHQVNKRLKSFDLNANVNNKLSMDLKDFIEVKNNINSGNNTNLRKNSNNFRKSSESKNKLVDSDNTVMEKNTIENPLSNSNRDLSNDIKKFIENNNNDVSKLSLDEIKKMLNYKKDLEIIQKLYNKKKEESENNANANSINNINNNNVNVNINVNNLHILKNELLENKSNKSKEKINNNNNINNMNTIKDEQIYNKLNDYKKKHFEKSNSTNNKIIDEKINNNNVFNYQINNLKNKNLIGEEVNIRGSNEIKSNNEAYNDYHKSKMIDIANKNILDKTKLLLSKNSLGDFYEQNNKNNFLEENNNFNKKFNKEKINQLKDSDIFKGQKKESKNMIIINNNININTFVNNDIKKDIDNMRQQYEDDFERINNKNFEYKKNYKNKEDYNAYNLKQDDDNNNLYCSNNNFLFENKQNDFEFKKRKTNSYGDLRQSLKFDNYKKYDNFEGYSSNNTKKNEDRYRDDIYPKNIISSMNKNFNKDNNNNNSSYKKFDYRNNLAYLDENLNKY